MSADISQSAISIIAAPLISVLVNWGFFGALSIQVYFYSQAFPKDNQILKCMVYGIYLLETAQTFLLAQRIWKAITNIGDAKAQDTFGVEAWVAVCVLGGTVALIVQIFYAYRIRSVSQSLYIPLVIILMSVSSFIGAIGSGIYISKVHYLSHLLDNKALVYAFAGLWLGVGSMCDILIALSMCFYLQKRGEGIPFKATQKMISKIIRLTVETGTLTASLSVVSLLIFCVRSLVRDWEAPLSATAKVYSTTLLAVLNSRMRLVSVSTTVSEVRSIHLSQETAASSIAFRVPESYQLGVKSSLASNYRESGEGQPKGIISITAHDA